MPPSFRAFSVPAAAAVMLMLAACAGGDQAAVPSAQGEPAAAEQALTGALADMAVKAEREGDYAAAAGHYARLRDRASSPAEGLAATLGEARTLRYAGAPQEAIGLLRRSLETPLPKGGTARVEMAAADERALRLELAKAQLALGLVPDAMAQVREVRRLGPEDAEALMVMGIAYDRQGRWKDARAAYEAALALAPGDAQTINNYALSLAQNGDMDKARALLQDLAAQPDAPVQARQNLALLHALAGDMDAAVRLTRQSLPPELAERAIADMRRLAAGAATSPASP